MTLDLRQAMPELFNERTGSGTAVAERPPTPRAKRRRRKAEPDLAGLMEKSVEPKKPNEKTRKRRAKSVVAAPSNPAASPRDKRADASGEERWAGLEQAMEDMVDEILSRKVTAVDLFPIDDRDLPAFPNFYEFCMSRSGANTVPYARQLWLAIHLLGEWCPRCSIKAFRDIERMPVGYDVGVIEDKVTLLQHGECPSCGATRRELLLKRSRANRRRGPLNLYVEMDALIGQRGGKALAMDTLVPTPSGWTRHGDIRPGEKVYSMYGDQVAVTGIGPVIVNAPCVKVVFDTGEEIVCHEEHEWVTDFMRKSGNRSYERGVHTARDIADTLQLHNGNDYYVSRHSVPISGTLECNDADLPIPPYTLGAWLGDGTSGKGEITASVDDAPQILDGIAGDGFEIEERDCPSATRWKLDDSGDLEVSTKVYKIEGLAPLLRQHGLLGNKHIPRVYLRASARQRLALLQGLMDTDGHCDARGHCEFVTTNKRFGPVVELIRSMGIKVTKPKSRRATLYGRDIGPKWCVSFVPAAGVPVFRMARKRDRLAEANRAKDASGRRRMGQTRRIVDVHPVESVPVRCISVEPGDYEKETGADPEAGGTYLCGRGMIPTHNSAVSHLLSAYLLHRWLKTDNPVESLGLMRNSILVGTFVGLTYAKAIELLWTPIFNIVSQCDWFVEMHKLLDFYSQQYGHELYRFRSTFLHYNHKSLFFAPSGPNKRTLRGATRILSVQDEIGWFPAGEEKEHLEKASANEVYAALDRSLKTARVMCTKAIKKGANIPMAYNIAISSPSSYWDKIMTLERSHRGSLDVLTCKLATWEMNPDIMKKDLDKEYREDPIKAERDFNCNPPMGQNLWISDVSPVLSAAQDRSFSIDYRYKHNRTKAGQLQRYADITGLHDRARTGVGRVLTLDSGFSGNSFAATLSEPIEKDGASIGVRVLGMAEIAPQKGRCVVNYSRASKLLLYPIIEQCDVRLVVADRWESLKILSDIDEDFGIPAIQYSLRPDDFKEARSYLVDDVDRKAFLPHPGTDYDGVVRMVDVDNYPECFKYQPVPHFVYQLMVSDVDDRGTVQKGAGATDDLLRSAVLGVYACLNPKLVDECGLLRSAGKGPKRALGTMTASYNGSSDMGALVMAGAAGRSGSARGAGGLSRQAAGGRRGGRQGRAMGAVSARG